MWKIWGLDLLIPGAILGFLLVLTVIRTSARRFMPSGVMEISTPVRDAGLRTETNSPLSPPSPPDYSWVACEMCRYGSSKGIYLYRCQVHRSTKGYEIS